VHKAPQEKSQLETWWIRAGCGAYPHEGVRETPSSAKGRRRGGHVESLRRRRGDTAGAELGTSPVERFMVNVGTISAVPSPDSSPLPGGKARCRPRPRWDGGVVVVRGRESRLHGEGLQRVRSIDTGRGGRW